MAFFALGDVVTALLYQSRRFTHADSLYVWGIVGGSAVGLLASTMGRLYSGTYYALRDTRTPLRFAVVRVVLTCTLGYVCAIPLPHWIGIDPQWGAAGLTASAGAAGWVEFALLRRTLNARIGGTGLSAVLTAKLWASAALAAAAAWAVKLAIGPPGLNHDPILSAIPILGIYGVVYFAATWLMAVEECAAAFSRLNRLRS
jgi:putative peptidoglycan lipid II flippase